MGNNFSEKIFIRAPIFFSSNLEGFAPQENEVNFEEFFEIDTDNFIYPDEFVWYPEEDY